MCVEVTAMRWAINFAAVALMAQTVVTAEASMMFIRSVPEEGVWAEWKIESELTSAGVAPRMRLTAGNTFERDGRRFQNIELTGVWEDGGKPVDLKARYEVDLSRLKKGGVPEDAVRVVTAYKKEADDFKEIAPDDPYMAAYRVMFFQLRDVAIQEETVHIAEPASLRGYDLRILTAEANTRHWGSGQAPRSKFKAWVGDEVPFGAAKWETTTVFRASGETVTITITATLEKHGKGAPEQPSLQPSREQPTRKSP
jgi:hypothetical protein